MHEPDVAAIIVTYRSAALTIAALRSLQAERRSTGLPIRAFIVDNASGDLPTIAEAVTTNHWCPWVSLIAAPRNGGFAYGNNLGIARACAQEPPDYLYLLNPDTEVRPGAIAALLGWLESHLTAGIAGSSFEQADGSAWKIAFRFPGLLSELSDGLQSRLATRLLWRWRVPMEMGDTPQRVDWVSGASMMIRPSVLAAIGGFDERYFLYFEETDFCRRAAHAGFSTWYVSQSRVMHLRGQSTQVTDLNRGRGRLPAYWFESRRRYFAVSFGRTRATLIDAVALLAHGLGWLKGALLLRTHSLTPHFVRDLWRHSLLRPRNRAIAPGVYGNFDRLPNVRPVNQGPLPAAAAEPHRTGVVVIGRNEGARLMSCLQSLRPFADRTVYVDSGSTDGSVGLGRSLGVHTLELDPARPFSAARARNEGFELLLKLFPDLHYVQFVDGDCEVAMQWPLQAAQFLRARPDVGVVWGGQREKYPRRTLYNHLCDLEWQQGPRGEALECGGNALMRVQAFRAVRGYRSDLVCGEEPELCVRLRRAGWRIWRLETPMATHDAAMVHFRQWWRRMQRGGYAFAQGAHLHGSTPERHWISQSRRAWLWGLGVPLAVIVGAALFGPAALLLLLAYPLQITRIALRERGADPGRHGSADRWLYATAVVLAKFPEMLGHLSFRVHALTRLPARLMEYK